MKRPEAILWHSDYQRHFLLSKAELIWGWVCSPKAGNGALLVQESSLSRRPAFLSSDAYGVEAL